MSSSACRLVSILHFFLAVSCSHFSFLLLALEHSTSILHVEFHSSLTFWVVTTFVSISGRFLTSWRVLLWNLLVLIHDVIIDAVLAPGIPDLILKKLIMVMTRALPYLLSTEIARGIPDPPPHSDPTTGDSSHRNINTSTPPSNPRPPQSSLTRSQSTPAFPPTPPAHLTVPFFPPPRVPAPRQPLNHVPRAHSPSIHMDHDHVPDNLLSAPIARRGRHVHHSHETMIDVVLPEAALLTLADTGDIDTAHPQHHAHDGTTVTVAAHILGDATLAHTNESHGSIVAQPTFPPHVPGLAIPAIIVAAHGQTHQHLAQLLAPPRTTHLSRLLPPFILLLIGALPFGTTAWTWRSTTPTTYTS